MQRREDYHLRPIQEKDLEMVLNWRNSDRIRANMFTDYKISRDEHRNWFENLKKQQINIYLIFEFQQRPVGLVYFTDIDRKNNTCYWGFYLGEKDLPKGTGTLLGIVGIEYAFDKLSIRKLCAKVFAFNETSIHLHKKLGFAEEGKFSKHILKNKRYEDVVFFALFKEAWQNTGNIREQTILFKQNNAVFVNGSKDKNTPFMQSATSTENLKARANINVSYGVNNFEAWVNSLLDKISYTSVLDICCGTGNQLLKYAQRNRNACIMGVDISGESLITAEKRLQSIGACRYTLKQVAMEEMFNDSVVKEGRFDLISCFYGLYYSQNVTNTLEHMVDHLSPHGTILIVGPYGKNNATLFDLLQRHYVLPELVVRSATTFMENEVLPVLSKRTSVSAETFVNPVRFPDVQSLVDYWRASTFFSLPHENAVLKDMKDHFAIHKCFILEKHVMAYLGQKNE